MGISWTEEKVPNRTHISLKIEYVIKMAFRMNWEKMDCLVVLRYMDKYVQNMSYSLPHNQINVENEIIKVLQNKNQWLSR